MSILQNNSDSSATKTQPIISLLSKTERCAHFQDRITYYAMSDLFGSDEDPHHISDSHNFSLKHGTPLSIHRGLATEAPVYGRFCCHGRRRGRPHEVFQICRPSYLQKMGRSCGITLCGSSNSPRQQRCSQTPLSLRALSVRNNTCRLRHASWPSVSSALLNPIRRSPSRNLSDVMWRDD